MIVPFPLSEFGKNGVAVEIELASTHALMYCHGAVYAAVRPNALRRKNRRIGVMTHAADIPSAGQPAASRSEYD